MNKIDFTFSDLIAGYVTYFDSEREVFGLKTCDDRPYEVRLTKEVFGELVRNLGEAYHDATGQLREMLIPGRFLFVYGVFYPDGEGGDSVNIEAKHVVFVGRTENEYRFEKQDWWIKQVRQLADFYLKSEFPEGRVDYDEYRTNLAITGDKQKSGRQETDTISRLVYGFASAYLMTGDDRYLEAAQKGTDYLRQHMRFEDTSEGICYWYHAVDIKEGGTEQKIFASENGDDYDAIPCYEQIYALAGPTQTYRVTGDPRILHDIQSTVNLFHRFFKDKSDRGGYYSHIDPIALDPHSESLGHNRARKNWNSVGDHAPAYLINLYLATGSKEYADFLEYTFDTISEHFPDYDECPFVQEKFLDDWSKDQEQPLQLNRAIVGHNLKIAWNLLRMYNLKPKDTYRDFAEKIASLMPQVGRDRQRGGWYDMVERSLRPGEKFHRLVWHDRKAWWQQEQGILAYLILHGVLKSPEYLKVARESAAFYNAWQLDVDSGGVYFNVLANGLPYSLGTERGKGSHSMAGYHSFELAYLAAVYTNLLITKEPMDFYFCPQAGGFADDILRVQPDILPPGSVTIGQVWINGQEYSEFDSESMTVKLPSSDGPVKVRVRLVPSGVTFSADMVSITDQEATISLSGTLEPTRLKYLEEQVQEAISQGVTTIVLQVEDLQSICSEALRYLAYTKQHVGSDFSITVVGANDTVKAAIDQSELSDEVGYAEAAVATGS